MHSFIAVVIFLSGGDCMKDIFFYKAKIENGVLKENFCLQLTMPQIINIAKSRLDYDITTPEYTLLQQ